MRLRVEVDDAGARLDAFLAAPLGSRARAARAIAEGRVRVDGELPRKAHAVRAGEIVEWEEAAADEDEEAAAPAPYTVAYEDEHLLVVDKPAGVVVHPGKGRRTGTLAQALIGRAAGGEADRAGIVHRLDKGTSGLLVVARSNAVHEALKAQIQAREVRREYLALVLGRPASRTGTIDAPIGRDRQARTRISTDTDEPRAARTHFALERALPEASLLRVTLETGRTHQIRVHLAAIGLPVAGDPEYGAAGAYGLERQFLHAARLAFAHPVTSEPIDVASPLPEDLEAALRRASTNVR
jgi:23S rRNA pseudouridine1911/1915/1917 synthase